MPSFVGAGPFTNARESHCADMYGYGSYDRRGSIEHSNGSTTQ